MAITKPAVKPIWADTAANPADIVMPPDPDILTGWPLTTTPPSRQRFNGIFNYLWNAVRYFSRRGIVDHDVAETYMSHDIARGSDGRLYRSIQDNNTNHAPPNASWWGSIAVSTPAADDNSFSVANTAYVIGQISVSTPTMDGSAAVGTSLKFARADHVHPSDSSKANTSGSYPGLSVGSAASAANVPFNGVTSKPNTCAGYGITDAITTATIGSQSVAFATNASRARPRRSDDTAIDFNWSGQSGQPNWLVGSNDGIQFYVWNPANFSVNFASNANFAASAGAATTQPVDTQNTQIATTAFANPARLKSSTGFFQLPSGMIHQFGSLTVGDIASGFPASQFTISFPTSFPIACASIQLTRKGSARSAVWGVLGTPTQSSFVAAAEEWTSSVQGADHGFYWSADGY